MMMFLTMIMLIVGIVSVIKGGLRTTMMKSYNNHYYLDENDKWVEKEGLSNEQRVKIIAKGCLIIILLLILAVLQGVFLIASLSVDIFIVPSVVMLLWLVYRIVRSIVRKKRTNKELMEHAQKGAFQRWVFLLYVVYIFILLVI